MKIDFQSFRSSNSIGLGIFFNLFWPKIEMKIRAVPNNNIIPGSDTGVGLTLTSIANALPVVKRSTDAVKIEIPNDFFMLFLTFPLNVLNNVDKLIFLNHGIFQFRVK